MIHKIKNLLLAFSALLTIGFSSVAMAANTVDCSLPNNASTAACQQNTINGNLCQGSNFNLSGNGAAGDTQYCNNSGNNSLSARIRTILNLFSALIGVVAVIMIIYAGFRYVTSAGSEGGVKSAKNAIIYAVIGLVIVALAQVIVHFVITNVT